MSAQVHRLSVDHSERHSALLEAARRSGAFDVRMVHLDTGDYLIDDEVLVERKTIGDFVASLVDGRLFPQTARLAHSRYRSLLMIEGPRPPSMPDVHPRAVEGAIVSLAAMWRLPVLHSSGPGTLTPRSALAGRSSDTIASAGSSSIRSEAEATRLKAAVRAPGISGRWSRARVSTARSLWIH
jgi:ERCC4-type nuclease